MSKTSKEQLIEEELQRLNELFKRADANEKALAAPLFQNAAFMAATLRDLQESINETGAVEEYQNGASQHGYKQSAAVQAYNALVKNFNAVMKELAKLLPPSEQARSIPPHIRWQIEHDAAEAGFDPEEAARKWRESVARAEEAYLEEQAE